MLYAPSRVGPGAPSGRRRPLEPGVSVCPLAGVPIPPWVFGPPGPHRFDHAATHLLSPNVALWVAGSSLHQFGVSDCQDRLFEDAATAPNTVQGIASVGIEFDGVFGVG
ncbi:hypothetical protein NDU88_004208 [Pleurodeles waltl]|uniref:Uncharacterized protein n=1 Tax=Pleurodeles waltl TaxID=8319 RepID=A0AAV7MVT7_PLEWA|nr:hypothetical protein NDU88_004208 [Pleurodeles waltl]